MLMFMLAYYVLCFLLVFSTSALAYIDPASTSYIIQIIGGVFLAGGAAVAIYWHKIKLFFRKRKEKKLQEDRARAAAAKQAQE